MVKLGCEVDFTGEAGGIAGGEVGVQYLHCHPAAAREVVGEVDPRHAAATELPVHSVPAGEGGLDPYEMIGQADLGKRDP